MQHLYGMNVYSNEDQLDTIHETDGIYYGLRWQCVELARRYLIQNHRITFPSIPCAFDLFSLSSFYTLDSIPVPIQCLPNGSTTFPRIGSLLIWDKKGLYQGTGHVAIVTRIYPHSIQLIEQNTDTLTRTIGFEQIGNQVWVEDVLGWIHYGQ